MYRNEDFERHRFIDISNKKDIIKYFKSIKRLSKIEPYFRDIFNNDKEYCIRTRTNRVQNGGLLMGLFSKKPQQICTDRDCKVKKNDLGIMLENLKIISQEPFQSKKWEIHIDRFMDFLVCCNTSYFDPINNNITMPFEYNNYIKNILALIMSNSESCQYGHKVFRNLIIKDVNFQNNDFLNEVDRLFEDVMKRHKTPIYQL